MREVARWLLTVATAAAVALLLARDHEAPVARSSGPDPRLDDLLARVDALDRRLAAPPPPAAASAGGPALVARIESIEKALAALQAAPKPVEAAPAPSLDRLGDAELRDHARKLSRQSSPEAEAAWRAYLARNLTAEERSAALDELGSVQFKANQFAAAVETFRRGLEAAGGRATERGQSLSHSLAWSLQRSGDPAAGLAEIDRLLAEPRITEVLEVNARSAASIFAQELGDTVRARAELRAILDRWGARSDPYFRRIAENARSRLEAMD